MLTASILTLALAAPPRPPADPPTAAESVRRALLDARAVQPATVTVRTRYVSQHQYAARPASAERDALLRESDTVLRGLVPSLSTGTARKGGIRIVAGVPAADRKGSVPWLWAVDGGHYGFSLETFGNLNFADPYYHEPTHDVRRESPVSEHVPALEYRELSALVGSERGTPIFRLDYLLERTSRQVGALNDGPYDFLGLRTVRGVPVADGFAAAETLAGVDRAGAKARDADRLAFVTRSRIGQQFRLMEVVDALHGPALTTFDGRDSTGGRNVVVQLDRVVADGGMACWPLPNRLMFTFLFAAKVSHGKAAFELQDSAPDFLAGEHAGLNLDTRIHPVRCFHCHREGGLRLTRSEFGDWYTAESPFVERDQARARRVAAVFGTPGEFEELIETAAARYDRHMVDACGVGYRAWGQLHRRLLDERFKSVDLAGASWETGASVAVLRTAFRRFQTREGPGRNNPVIAALLAGQAVRRELYDEIHPLLMQELRQESR